MTFALALPDIPTDLVPAGWADDVRAAVAGIDSIDTLQEGTSNLDACVAKFRRLRKDTTELEKASRWVEVRIGELLGDPENHGPATVPHAERLHRTRRHEFRALAAHPDVVAAELEAGNTSRRALLNAIAARNHTPLSDTANGLYRTVVADPPWRYGNTATRGAAADHYPTMSQSDLIELEPPAADDAHLYLWATNAFLRDALDLVAAWGFTYKTAITWVKPQIGLGNYFRNATEHVLFGVKGSLPTLRRDVPTWLKARRGRHSAKPEAFYDLIETVSPEPRLEMFARRRRLGWDVWGNEA